MRSALKTPRFRLETLLDESGRTRAQKLAALATLNLGVVEALSNGAMQADDAAAAFFNAENCLWVHRRLKSTIADDIMSRGVQLGDLFDVLPAAKAKIEFAKELAAIRRLCVSLLRR